MSTLEHKRVRAKKLKSRTGCKTCKLRRVKCDEGKPFCTRCLNFGINCEGYEANSGFQALETSRNSTLREILPRINYPQALLVPLMRNVTYTKFQGDQEYMYFVHFQEETSLELASPFDASLWNRVVLQACENEPSLYRLTAAVGALNKATRTRDMNPEMTNTHQKYAKRQYGRALRSINDRISVNPGRDSARLALVTSLLIYCFENIHGDVHLGIKHMESALHLMQEQLVLTDRHYKHLKNISPTPALEHDLVAAFVRVDNSLLSRTDNSTAKAVGSLTIRPAILNINYSEDIYDIPPRFQEINEAGLYLEDYQFRALPSLAHEFGVHIQESSENLDAVARGAYELMSAQLHEWKVAFEPLFTEALIPGNKSTIAATTMQVQALSTGLAAQRICARGMVLSPDFTIPESREIIDLSRCVVSDSSFRRTFVFDCGVVPALFIVVVTCLDMELRKEGLQLLRQTIPRREGPWDSAALAEIGEKTLRMEGAEV